MPSEIIPSLDLAPSVPSRIVRITAADITKGTPQAGKTVTFKLRGDLRVPADGAIISAGSVTLTLDEDGKGRVRLPCYTDDTRADSADGEWYLEVVKSWVSQTDLIRVPVGTSSIALAAIEPVRELPLHLAPSWLVTGAGVEVVEGSQWGATVVVNGGVARFRFTVPPGGTAWARGTLDANSDVDALRGRSNDGVYAVQSPLDAAALNLPEETAGVLRVESLGTGNAAASQTFKPLSSARTWERTISGGSSATWSSWTPTPTSGDVAEAIAPLRDITAPLERTDDTQFRVRDRHGRLAFGITREGHSQIGSTQVRDARPGYRVMDRTGAVALEVQEDGRTFIGELADGATSTVVTTLHVFIAAGQSNMSGRGQPLQAPTGPRIFQFGANQRVLEPAPVRLDMVDSPSGTSPASFFARNYLATQPAHVGVLLVPAARGATALSGSPESPASGWTWVKGAAPSPEYALYERSVEQTQDAIAAAEAAGYLVVLTGVLWHQGEGNGGLPTESYAARLDALIDNYRTDLDAPTLPFVAGQMCPEGMVDSPSKYTVDAAHRDTPQRVPRTGFAPATWGGHNPGDTTHFSTRGNDYFGNTFAAGYVQALGNVHPHT